MGGEVIGIPGGPDSIHLTPQGQAAMQRAAERAEREAALIPNKGEQRRIASVQFAIASRPNGYDTGKDLITVAEMIDKFISSGPNN